MLAEVFQAHGLTTLALAYVMEEGLPSQFTSVPMDYKKATAFKGDRGKNKEAGLKDRLDSLEKTLEFVSQW